MIAALILAAGRSLRMGTPKLLLTIAGQSLLRHVIQSAQASRCDEILVVVGDTADRVGQEAAAAGVRTVLNPRYREGIGTSLAGGIAALPRECEAAVVLLGDQPRVDAGAINALIDAYRATGKPLVASRYGHVRGAPTLIGRMLFEEAARLGGDQGGRPLIERHPDLVADVVLAEDAARDINTPEDFAQFKTGDPDPPPAGPSSRAD